MGSVDGLAGMASGAGSPGLDLGVEDGVLEGGERERGLGVKLIVPAVGLNGSEVVTSTV